MATHILTTGKGKNKRQFELDEDEFNEFLLRYEENELVDLSHLTGKQVILTQRDPKTGAVIGSTTITMN